MSLIVPWLVFPAVLAVLSTGCGLLVEAVSGTKLGTGLLLPTGFALVVTIGLVPPIIPGCAWASTPLVTIASLAGFVISRRVRPAIDRAAAAAAVGTFAIYGAPVYLSGRATFAGFVKLDDTATYLAMLDRFMGHGYDTAGLAPSTYEATVNTTLVLGYPMGSLVPLGVGQQIVGTDLAWLWQPYLTFVAALVALALYGLLAPILESRWLRGAAAFIAAQSALLYGYVLWGGVKEITAAMLLVLGCALVGPLLKAERARELVPLAVCSTAFLGVLSAGGALWVVPVGVVAIVWAVFRGGRKVFRLAPLLVLGIIALAAPTLVAARHWLSHSSGFGNSSELANLGHKLGLLQIAGIWPAGDFRASATHGTITRVLIALVVCAAVAGVVVAVRARAFGVLAYLIAALGGAALFDVIGSPWIAGKGLATASPALLAAGLGALGALAGRRRLVVLLAVPLAAGVLWSNALAYRDVWLAPSGRYAELESIGQRFAGDGPTLMTEYDSYAVRHFLRRMDPEGAAELRRRDDPLRSGKELETGDSADVDEFALPTLLPYRTLILRRSPAASRPPSNFRLVWQGHFYDVWQQIPGAAAQIVDHLQLGDNYHAAVVPPCSRILSLAREAGQSGALVTDERPTNAALSLTGARKIDYGAYGERTDAIYLDGRRTFEKKINVAGSGPVEIGVDGTVQGTLVLFVDGRRAGSIRSELNWPSEYQRIAVVTLAPGTHSIMLSYSSSSWIPGTSGPPAFGTGPLIVGSAAGIPPLMTVPVGDARTLCGKSLDWVEAVRG